MMKMRRYVVSVTTIADGSATAFSERVRGNIHSISYVKPGAASYTDGVDFTITSEDTGASLWTDTNINASETVYPVVAANLAGTGAASVLTEVRIAIVGRVKIVIAAGGDSKVGSFIIMVGG